MQKVSNEQSWLDQKLHSNQFHLHIITLTYMYQCSIRGQFISFLSQKNLPTAGVKCPSTTGSGHWNDYRAFFKKSVISGKRKTTLKTGALIHYWCKCKLVQHFWRKTWQFLTKLHMNLTFDPAIPLIGIYLEDTPLTAQKYICTGHLLQHCL